MADGNVLLSTWNKITGWIDQNATKYTYLSISRGQTDKNYDEALLKPDASYFRFMLSDMFLKKSVVWGIERFPAVHAEVKLKFGNQGDVVFSRLAQPPQNQLSSGVWLNYALTDLVPYNGGIVELEAALFALQGGDYAATAVKVLQEFSGLVTAPLGQVLNLASKLTIGTRDLLSAAQGDVHLGFHQTFTGSTLKPGYHAVILAPKGTIKDEQLSVQSDQLYWTKKGNTPPEALQDYDYMLFFIEGALERDDLLLKNIKDPLQEALTALDLGEEQSAEGYKKVAIAAGSRSPDLTSADQRRVVQAIKDTYKKVQSGGMGAVGKVEDLNAIIKARAMPLAQAVALGELSPEEAFAD